MCNMVHSSSERAKYSWGKKPTPCRQCKCARRWSRVLQTWGNCCQLPFCTKTDCRAQRVPSGQASQEPSLIGRREGRKAQKSACRRGNASKT